MAKSGARGKRRGFSPRAAARPMDRIKATEDFWEKSDKFEHKIPKIKTNFVSITQLI